MRPDVRAVVRDVDRDVAHDAMPRSRAAPPHALPLAEEEELDVALVVASPRRASCRPPRGRRHRGRRGRAPSPSTVARRSRAFSAAKRHQSSSQARLLGRVAESDRASRCAGTAEVRRTAPTRRRRMCSFQSRTAAKSTRSPGNCGAFSERVGRRNPSSTSRSRRDEQRVSRERRRARVGRAARAGRPEREHLPERLPRRRRPVEKAIGRRAEVADAVRAGKRRGMEEDSRGARVGRLAQGLFRLGAGLVPLGLAADGPPPQHQARLVGMREAVVPGADAQRVAEAVAGGLAVGELEDADRRRRARPPRGAAASRTRASRPASTGPSKSSTATSAASSAFKRTRAVTSNGRGRRKARGIGIDLDARRTATPGQAARTRSFQATSRFNGSRSLPFSARRWNAPGT